MTDEPLKSGWLHSARRLGPVRLLTHGQFPIFTAGQFLSLIGTWMQRIAYGWLIWEWTHSAFWLGLLATADLLPVMVIGPFSGVAADRLDRRRMMQFAQVVLTGLTALVAALLALDVLGPLLLLAIVTLQGSITAISQPARLTLIQQLVRREDLPIAVAVSSATVNLTRMIGPAVGGFLIVHAGTIWVFIGNAFLTAFFVFTLGILSLPKRDIPPASGNIWAQMFEGFRYVATTTHLRMALFFMLAGGALVRVGQELMPAFAAQSFPVVASGLATLAASMAAGAVAAGLTMGLRSAARLFVSIPITWGCGALAIVVLGFSNTPALAIAAAVALGFCVAHSVISIQTFVQLITPDGVRGRVLSVHGMLSRGSPALGALLIGYLSDRIGLSWAVLVGAVAFIAIAAVLAPAIRRISRPLEQQDWS